MKNIRENDKETDEFPEDTDNNACADHSSIQHNDVAVRHKTSTPFLGVLVEMVSIEGGIIIRRFFRRQELLFAV